MSQVDVDIQKQEQAKFEELMGIMQYIASKNLLLANFILSEGLKKNESTNRHSALWQELSEQDFDKMQKLLDEMNKATKSYFKKIKKLGQQAGVIIELEASLAKLEKINS